MAWWSMLGFRDDGSELENAEKKSKLSEAYFESLTASAVDWQTGPVASSAMAIDDEPHANPATGKGMDETPRDR